LAAVAAGTLTLFPPFPFPPPPLQFCWLGSQVEVGVGF